MKRFVLLLALAAPLRAQVPRGIYLEPWPRAASLRMNPDLLRALDSGAPSLGIPSARDFFVAAPAKTAVREGDLPMLVIQALFLDSQEPTITAEPLQRQLFDGPAAGGTLTEYYRDASRGKLRVRGTVTPWVRTSVTVREAAGLQNGHGWIGARIRQHVAESIRLADATVDFARFDNDGADNVPNSGDDDGYVDGLAIKSHEVSGACGGPGPWPHFGAARDSANNVISTNERTPAGQPIRVQVYITDSVFDCSGSQLDGIAVLAHEMGHLIGLPDLYRLFGGTERENRAWTVGCFDLMAAGGWGCGTGPMIPRFGPTHFSPVMKERLGWLNFVDVQQADRAEFVLEPAQTSATALRVRLAPNSLESFIVEYRPAVGFDAALPASGVVIYHHDAFPDERPAPSSLPRPFWYHLVEADGDNGLRRTEVEGGNRGSATDVFAGGGTVATLDDTSNPSTRDHLGGTTTLTIHSIRIDGNVARVTLSVGQGLHVAARELPIPLRALEPVTGRVRLSGGTPPYGATLVAGRLPDGMNAGAQGDELRISGTPLEVGNFDVSFLIRDAANRQISDAIRLPVADAIIATPVLMASLSASSLDTTRRYLDTAGNRNGRFDVGDLRAYMQRTSQLR